MSHFIHLIYTHFPLLLFPFILYKQLTTTIILIYADSLNTIMLNVKFNIFIKTITLKIYLLVMFLWYNCWYPKRVIILVIVSSIL